MKVGKATAAPRAALQVGPNVIGQWGPLETLDTVPVHINLLPDGRLLYWGRDKAADKWDRGGGCQTYTWHPTTKAKMTITNSTTNLFCAGHSLLPDGRLLVTGGHVRDDADPGKEGIGEDDVNIFNPANNTWTLAGLMPKGRWYPSNVTLPSGETLIVSGYINGTAARNDTPDIYTLNNIVRPFTASSAIPVYPYLHLWNNGRVFVGGPGGTNATKSFYQHPSSTWDGQFTNITTPPNSHFEGTSVTYDAATNKVLMTGGRTTTGGVVLRTAETIDLSNSSPFWQATSSMTYKRKYHNATVLPDGKVLVTGGTQCVGSNNIGCAEGAANVPEVWNPQTGTWTSLAPSPARPGYPNGIPRVYHSVGLLLPDARVLVGGGGLPAAGGEVVPSPTGTPETCIDGQAASDSVNCRTFGHNDVEIYSPPYLFNPDGTPATQPVINSAPDSISYYRNFTVGVNNPSSIAKVSLVRLPSVTHGLNYDQRAIFLTAVPNGTSSLNVYSPMLSEMMPPGHYMLFLINSSGVPSKAKIIKLEEQDGYVDGISCNQVWGWAWDRNNPNSPVNLDVLVNDTYLGTVTANIFRQDLLNAGKGNGFHGFVFNLPSFPVQDGRAHSVKVKLSVMPMSQSLNLSPRPVICGALMFPPSPSPLTSAAAGASTWEQSIQFSSAVSGKITHIRYYKASGEFGSHVGRLWSDTGVLLAQANFTNESSFGWQEAALTTPYPITAGVKYRVSYNVNANGFGAKIQSAFGPPIVKWPLTAWGGTYSTPAGSFPNTGSTSNFLADVRFSLY
ncbi:MAG: DUF4082 domain-containing protein [Pyrinomonadaceae bacterium]